MIYKVEFLCYYNISISLHTCLRAKTKTEKMKYVTYPIELKSIYIERENKLCKKRKIDNRKQYTSKSCYVIYQHNFLFRNNHS